MYCCANHFVKKNYENIQLLLHTALSSTVPIKAVILNRRHRPLKKPYPHATTLEEDQKPPQENSWGTRPHQNRDDTNNHHVWYKFFFGFWMFQVLSDIHLGSNHTHNPKYHKIRSIRYLCRVRISLYSFLSDQIWFGFLGSVYLPSPKWSNISDAILPEKFDKKKNSEFGNERYNYM